MLKTSDDEVLDSEPGTDEKQSAPLVRLAPRGGVATADLTYGGGSVSEGGTQAETRCGKEATSAEVSDKDATWQAEIRSGEAGNADSVPGGLIVCGPEATVTAFQE